MDFKKLLESMDRFAGQAVGQKPGDQVRGTHRATTGGEKHPFLKRLVGSKPEKKLRNHEQELTELWQQFKEDDLGTHPRRPARAGSREEKYGRRGHKEVPRYKTIKEYTPTPPGAPAKPPVPGQPGVDPAAAAALKQSLGKLKTSVPGLDITKATTTMAKADTGTKLSPGDTQIISTMAPQLANVIKNPQMVGQLKTMMDKAGQQDLAQLKKQQGITK